jgi:hypothetical protein
MKRMNLLGVLMCCGVMAGLCGVASAQPADLKPAKPTVPAMPTKEAVKDAIKGAQPEKKDANPANAMPAEKQAEMDAWMKAGEPGEMHKWLARGVGNWDATVKMTYPGEASTESVGTMKIEMIFGGRYQKGYFKGDMMGMPFEGFETTGYNNTTKMFEGTWMDSFSTATMTTKGTLESDKLVLKGEMMDPAKNQLVKERQVMSYSGNDKMVAEFYHELDGKDVLVMTINYTRSAATSGADAKPADKTAMEKAKEEAMKKAQEEMKKSLPKK